MSQPLAIRYIKFFTRYGWTWQQVRNTPEEVLLMCEIYMSEEQNESDFPPGFEELR